MFCVPKQKSWKKSIVQSAFFRLFFLQKYTFQSISVSISGPFRSNFKPVFLNFWPFVKSVRFFAKFGCLIANLLGLRPRSGHFFQNLGLVWRIIYALVYFWDLTDEQLLPFFLMYTTRQLSAHQWSFQRRRREGGFPKCKTVYWPVFGSCCCFLVALMVMVAPSCCCHADTTEVSWWVIGNSSTVLFCTYGDANKVKLLAYHLIGLDMNDLKACIRAWAESTTLKSFWILYVVKVMLWYFWR